MDRAQSKGEGGSQAGSDTFEFDVFISYSHKDEKWVREWLLPRLEGAGLKVCIDWRDFKIGAPALEVLQLRADPGAFRDPHVTTG